MHELLETGRLDHEQEPGPLGADRERVRDISRSEHERPGGSGDDTAADPEGQLALDHVEPLVLVVMYVERRAASTGSVVLGHGDASAGCLRRRLDDHQSAEEPSRLALVGTEPDRLHCARTGLTWIIGGRGVGHAHAHLLAGDLVDVREFEPAGPWRRSLGDGDISCTDPQWHTRTVSTGRWWIDRLIDEVAALERRGLPRERYYAEVAARLRRVFDFDAACWHTLDPQTRLITSDASDELVSAGIYTQATVADAGAKLVASEYFTADVNTFAALAARRVPVGILSQATKGRPERSTRYTELLDASGIPFEMRGAFVTRGRVWGAVHLARRDHSRDFTAQEATALASVTRLVADGIRTSLRFDAAREPQSAASPGLVVLGPTDDIEMITPPAREILATMESRRSGMSETPPSPVLALAAYARSRATPAHGSANAVAVPTSAGWVTLHASLPEGRDRDRVAIVVERAVSQQSTAVRLEADGVTPREREVATLLAQGLTNPEIAEALVLSPYTVQDHIKSLFDKTGVSSRQELIARIFLDDYLPQLAQRTPLTARGGFGQD